MYDKNENGTYKNIQYRLMQPDGTYYVIDFAETLVNGRYNDFHFTRYSADGVVLNSHVAECGDISISSDGLTIIEDGWDKWEAFFPEN